MLSGLSPECVGLADILPPSFYRKCKTVILVSNIGGSVFRQAQPNTAGIMEGS